MIFGESSTRKPSKPEFGISMKRVPEINDDSQTFEPSHTKINADIDVIEAIKTHEAETLR